MPLISIIIEISIYGEKKKYQLLKDRLATAVYIVVFTVEQAVITVDGHIL